jgi:hypothetical protein
MVLAIMVDVLLLARSLAGLLFHTLGKNDDGVLFLSFVVIFLVLLCGKEERCTWLWWSRGTHVVWRRRRIGGNYPPEDAQYLPLLLYASFSIAT